jgi:hypothetical protein
MTGRQMAKAPAGDDSRRGSQVPSSKEINGGSNSSRQLDKTPVDSLAGWFSLATASAAFRDQQNKRGWP